MEATLGIEHLLGLCVGIGLAAACGFRVFVPLLMTSIAAYSGHLQLAEGFEWIGTPEAITAFSVATVLEVGAYYVPWIDNLLDTVGTPAAAIAGTILTSSMITDVSPFLQWALAIIAGGGVATASHVGFAAVRGLSSTMTGGLGNAVISTVEFVGSVALAVLSLLAPVIAVALLVVGVIFVVPQLPKAASWVNRKLTPQMSGY